MKGFSGSAASAGIVQEFYDDEARNPTVAWFSRVPSFSNPADLPSRFATQECADLFGASVVQIDSFTDAEIKDLISRTQSFL